jgi:hypothetical protein
MMFFRAINADPLLTCATCTDVISPVIYVCAQANPLQALIGVREGGAGGAAAPPIF